jgi:hypothetical protein
MATAVYAQLGTPQRAVDGRMLQFQTWIVVPEGAFGPDVGQAVAFHRYRQVYLGGLVNGSWQPFGCRPFHCLEQDNQTEFALFPSELPSGWRRRARVPTGIARLWRTRGACNRECYTFEGG